MLFHSEEAVIQRILALPDGALPNQILSQRCATLRQEWRNVLLGLLVLATFMMPITYRAGTNVSHSHTIFQVMIDAVVGHTHNHGNTSAHSGLAAPSPFSPAAAPLSAGHGAEYQTPNSEIDVANVLASAPAPVSHATAIHMLGALVALLLIASAAVSRHWPRVRSLVPVAGSVDVPPPRLAV